MNGFKCNGCGHEMLDPTTVNGWPCACGGKGQAMLDGIEAVTCAACGGP